MGNTTIIELNHDRWQEIERNHAAFVDAILSQLRQGNVKEIPGGRVVASFQRTSDSANYRAWERWKKKWSR